jgi:transposase
MPDALIVMEATAKYRRQPHRTLHAAGYAVAIVNPLRARLFAEAIGQLAKIDKLDARLLAMMGECLKPEARRLEADPAPKRRYDILISIPGVGPVAAIALVVGLPELGACSGKAASLLAGLAPLAGQSGASIGERHIKGGRRQVRTGLYFAAIAAARFNPQLSTVYKRLREAGKKPKVAITAVMRKLVILANVLIHEDRPWQPIHA